MKNTLLTLIALTALSGCAVPLVPTPQSARLSDQTLTLVLNTGEVCRTAWRAAPEGQLCGFDYRVTEVSNPNILRQIFTGLTKALGQKVRCRRRARWW